VCKHIYKYTLIYTASALSPPLPHEPAQHRDMPHQELLASWTCPKQEDASSVCLLKIIGLFWRISSLLYGSFAKETCNFKELTRRCIICISSVCPHLLNLPKIGICLIKVSLPHEHVPRRDRSHRLLASWTCLIDMPHMRNCPTYGWGMVRPRPMKRPRLYVGHDAFVFIWGTCLIHMRDSFAVWQLRSARHTGWRRCMGCRKLQVSYRKRATKF